MIYVVVKYEHDYSNCYYEGDTPNVKLKVHVFQYEKDAAAFVCQHGGELFRREFHI